MIILLDVDGVLADFVGCARTWVNECHGVYFNDEQVTDYNLMTSFGLPGGWPSFIGWLSKRRACLDIDPYDGAEEFVDDLRKLGRVVAVTTPFVGVSHWEADRRTWLEENFGFDQKDLVFCKDKSLVCGDVLIEDKPENCVAWNAAHNGLTILFDRPWNRSAQREDRARGYAEALALVAESRGGEALAGGGAK